jgi:hypothetical protein
LTGDPAFLFHFPYPITMNMLKIVTLVFALSVSSLASAQSNSFQTLTDRFAGEEDVNAFELNGLLCRAALWMAGDWEFRNAVHDLSSIRLITIPTESILRQNLTVGGYRRLLKADHFESLMNVKDHGSLVEIYIQETDNRKSRYLVLVEEKDDLTVIELKGRIDVEKLARAGIERRLKLNIAR